MPNGMKTGRLSRRDFLKLAGATGVALPTLIGLGLLYTSKGDFPDEEGSVEDDQRRAMGDQPILVVYNDVGGNSFGAYLGEILLAEGINSFNLIKLSELDMDSLSSYDIVLLSEGPLNQEQAEKISRYVFEGGNLLAMRPDSQLLPVLGVKDQMKHSDQGYLIINDEHELTLGIAPFSMQFHGVANSYTLDGAQAVAWLCDKTGDGKLDPAVSINKFGDGRVCTWSYDLAGSVALTRQGDPQWADQERDGFDGVRPSDMFTDWLDLDRIETPQADEQQRLLVNILAFFSQNKRPFPRLWYFPNMSKSMLIATSDAHQNPGWAMEKVIEHAEKHGGFISIYSLPPSYDVPHRAAQKVRWWLENMALMDEAYFPSPSKVAEWRSRGHEFGIHPLVDGGFVEGWRDNWERFTGVGYGPVSPTTRVHRILWDGWVESALLQAEYGFRMNFDYYHVGDAFRKKNGEWAYGHFTGSGLPMKFVGEDGRILNIYQQITQLADDHLLNLHWGGTVKMPATQAIEVSKTLLDRSIRGGYAAIGAIFHTDPFAVGEPWATEEGIWMDGTLAYAARNSVPIWSGEMWLNFVESRHDALVGNIQWNSRNGTLTFSIDIGNLRFGSMDMLLPLMHSGRALSGIEINGRAIKYDKKTLGSMDYACFSLLSGNNDVAAYFS